MAQDTGTRSVSLLDPLDPRSAAMMALLSEPVQHPTAMARPAPAAPAPFPIQGGQMLWAGNQPSTAPPMPVAPAMTPSTVAAAPTPDLQTLLTGPVLHPLPMQTAAPATPQTPTDPMAAAMQWADSQNQNAYGTTDPMKLDFLGTAGFPL